MSTVREATYEVLRSLGMTIKFAICYAPFSMLQDIKCGLRQMASSPWTSCRSP
jgi:hypothetical protein